MISPNVIQQTSQNPMKNFINMQVPLAVTRAVLNLQKFQLSYSRTPAIVASGLVTRPTILNMKLC